MYNNAILKSIKIFLALSNDGINTIFAVAHNLVAT